MSKQEISPSRALVPLDVFQTLADEAARRDIEIQSNDAIFSAANIAVMANTATRNAASATSLDDVLDEQPFADLLRAVGKATRCRECFNIASIAKIQVDREVGRWIAKTIHPGGNRRCDEKPKKPTLKDFGLDATRAFRFRKLAEVPDDVLEEYITKTQAEQDEITTAGLLRFWKEGGKLDPLFSGKSDEWWTPSQVQAVSRAVLREFDVDPCSNAGKPNLNGVKRVYRREDDGLQVPWSLPQRADDAPSRMLLNPPLSQVAEFVRKLLEEMEAGRVVECILLIPSRTDTRYFQMAIKHRYCTMGCFISGRLRFRSPDGKGTSAPFPSVCLYMSHGKTGRFTSHFEDIGELFQPLRFRGK